MLVYAPRFSKYMHGCASLNPDAVASMPYWFLKNDDGTLSTATWEEMADTSDNLDSKDKVRLTSNDTPLINGVLHKCAFLACAAYYQLTADCISWLQNSW